MTLLKNEVTIGSGKNPVSRALQELGIKPTEIQWEKSKSGKSMDRYFVEGDQIRINTENQIELLRLRMGTTMKIGVLKTEVVSKEVIQGVTEEWNNHKTIINVASWDTISWILNNIFWIGKYRYWDRRWSKNIPEWWDTIVAWESLNLETDGKMRRNRYLYTLYREKDGRVETITFVSSKLLRWTPHKSKESVKIASGKDWNEEISSGEKILRKPPISALMDIFPGVDIKNLSPIREWKPIYLIQWWEAYEYRLADSIINNTAKMGKISVQFVNWVIPKESDIVLIKIVGESYTALVYPKLEKSARSYASTPRDK